METNKYLNYHKLLSGQSDGTLISTHQGVKQIVSDLTGRINQTTESCELIELYFALGEFCRQYSQSFESIEAYEMVISLAFENETDTIPRYHDQAQRAASGIQLVRRELYDNPLYESSELEQVREFYQQRFPAMKVVYRKDEAL